MEKGTLGASAIARPLGSASADLAAPKKPGTQDSLPDGVWVREEQAAAQDAAEDELAAVPVVPSWESATFEDDDFADVEVDVAVEAFDQEDEDEFEDEEEFEDDEELEDEDDEELEDEDDEDDEDSEEDDSEEEEDDDLDEAAELEDEDELEEDEEAEDDEELEDDDDDEDDEDSEEDEDVDEAAELEDDDELEDEEESEDDEELKDELEPVVVQPVAHNEEPVEDVLAEVFEGEVVAEDPEEVAEALEATEVAEADAPPLRALAQPGLFDATEDVPDTLNQVELAPGQARESESRTQTQGRAESESRTQGQARSERTRRILAGR